MFVQAGKKLAALHDILRFGKDDVLKPLVRVLPARLTPNAVTWGRTVLALVWLPYALLDPALWQISIFGCIYFFDLLDGAIARIRDRVTFFGSMLDHMSDKLNNIAALLLLYGITGYQFAPFLFFVAWDVVTAVWIGIERGKTNSSMMYLRSPFEVAVKIALWVFLLWKIVPVLLV